MAYKVSDKLDVGANYWLIIAPRGALPARHSHVPQAVLIWHF